MLETKDDCGHLSCRKEALLEKLFYYDWSEEARGVRRTLSLLVNLYIQSDVVKSMPQPEREDLAFHVRILGELMDHLEQFQPNLEK